MQPSDPHEAVEEAAGVTRLALLLCQPGAETFAVFTQQRVRFCRSWCEQSLFSLLYDLKRV